MTAGSNELTLEDHRERIEDIRSRIKDSMFEMSDAVLLAYDQLEKGSFTQLAKDLGMGRSVLYKWVAISRSKFLRRHKDLLPDVFSSLYDIVTLEQKVQSLYADPKDALEHMQTYVDEGKFHKGTQQKDLQVLIKVVDEEIARRKNSLLGDAKRRLLGTSQPKKPSKYNLDQLIQKKKVFNTLLVAPLLDDLKRFSQVGFTEEDIHEKYQIADLRDVTHDGSILCVIRIPNRFLPTGLMMLSAFGFNYSGLVGAEHDDEEETILFGFRGRSKKIRLERYPTEDELMEEIERVGDKPRLSLWYPVDQRKGWNLVE